MVNPRPGSQAYDSNVSGYDSTRDVAQALPYVFSPNQSWVQSVSFASGDSGYRQSLAGPKKEQPATVLAGSPRDIVASSGWGTVAIGDLVAWDSNGAGQLRTVVSIAGNTLSVDSDCTPGADKYTYAGGWLRPQLRTAAILTCLSHPPPSDAFRPAYGQVGSKTLYRASQIQWGVLPRVGPAGTPPPISTVEAWFERPWLDNFGLDWAGSTYLHPLENMPWYGRDMSGRLSDAYLLLSLNTLTDAQKTTLLYRLIQIGIDNWWAAYYDATWPNNGGFAGGQKWTILFAGAMLNDSQMLSIGQQSRTPTKWRFGECEQTFYITQDDVDRSHDSPRQGYSVASIGTAEWGILHSTQPAWDDSRWAEADYRECCTAYSWVGYVLCARMMGLQSAYNHDALFDYIDRYMNTEVGGFRCYSDFSEAMWDSYR